MGKELFIEMHSIDGVNSFMTALIKDVMRSKGLNVEIFSFNTPDDFVGVQVIDKNAGFSALYAPKFITKPNIVRVYLDEIILKTSVFVDILSDYYKKFKSIQFGLDENRFGKWEFTIKHNDNIVSFTIPPVKEKEFIFRIKPGKAGSSNIVLNASKIFLNSPFGKYYLIRTVNESGCFNDESCIQVNLFKDRLLELITNVLHTKSVRTGFIGLTVKYDKGLDRFVIVNAYPFSIKGFGECMKTGKSYAVVFM